MAVFRWRHFAGEIILWAVRWYCRYGISYRELEEMLGERGVAVDHTTVYRWTQRYAPELEKRAAWYRRCVSSAWRPSALISVVPGPEDRREPGGRRTVAGWPRRSPELQRQEPHAWWRARLLWGPPAARHETSCAIRREPGTSDVRHARPCGRR